MKRRPKLRERQRSGRKQLSKPRNRLRNHKSLSVLRKRAWLLCLPSSRSRRAPASRRRTLRSPRPRYRKRPRLRGNVSHRSKAHMHHRQGKPKVRSRAHRASPHHRAQMLHPRNATSNNNSNPLSARQRRSCRSLAISNLFSHRINRECRRLPFPNSNQSSHPQACRILHITRRQVDSHLCPAWGTDSSLVVHSKDQ